MPRSNIGSASFRRVSPPPGPTFPPDATNYWPLNEASGARANILGGPPMTPSGTVTQVAGALDFAAQVNANPTGGHLATSDIADVRGAGDWTINFWAKQNGNPVALELLSQKNVNSIAGTAFMVTLVPGEDGNTCQESDGSSLNVFSRYGGPDVDDGAWHMWTYRGVEGSSETSFFIDGDFIETQNIFTGPNANSLPVNAGNFGNTDTTALQAISDVATWQRALSDEEITTLYNGGTPFRPDPV